MQLTELYENLFISFHFFVISRYFVTLGRAWLLLSLNEAVLEAFLATLEDRPSLLSEHYLPNALLRDPTSLQVLITLVSGLEHVGFDFLLVRTSFSIAAYFFSPFVHKFLLASFSSFWLFEISLPFL